MIGRDYNDYTPGVQIPYASGYFPPPQPGSKRGVGGGGNNQKWEGGTTNGNTQDPTDYIAFKSVSNRLRFRGNLKKEPRRKIEGGEIPRGIR